MKLKKLGARFCGQHNPLDHSAGEQCLVCAAVLAERLSKPAFLVDLARLGEPGAVQFVPEPGPGPEAVKLAIEALEGFLGVDWPKTRAARKAAARQALAALRGDTSNQPPKQEVQPKQE